LEEHLLRGNRLERLLGVGVGELLRALQSPEVAMDPRHRWRIHLDVEIGALSLDDVRERLIDVEAHPCPYRAGKALALAACTSINGGRNNRRRTSAANHQGLISSTTS